MFRVTLNHLDPKTIRPTLDIGLREHGKLAAADLLTLLAQFCQIDETENAQMEPEVRVEFKGDRYIFQTGSGKLHLYNARDRQAPAIVLTPAEALAELTRPPPAPPPRPMEPERAPPAGTAAAQPTFATNNADDLVYIPPPPPPPSRRVPILIGVLVVLLGGLAFLWISDARSAPPAGAPVAALPAAELAAARQSVVGVFMAAPSARRLGIALTDDGTVKLFRDNPVTAPSVVRATFRPAQRETKLVLVVEALGTLIEVSDPNTLVYGGETFRRLP